MQCCREQFFPSCWRVRRKLSSKGLASLDQTHTPRLVLHQVRKHDGPAAMPWRAEWDYKLGPALCMEKQQADCQDPSLNTFQSGLLWGVWALWSQLPTSTSVGSSLEAGTHSPNNPGFDPHSCCAVNLSGISAGERGHMDSPWDRNLIYPQKFPCGQQHCKIHFACMCQSHVCFSPAQNNKSWTIQPQPSVRLHGKILQFLCSCKVNSRATQKHFCTTHRAPISLSLFVPYLYGAEHRISKNTLVVFWSNCKINVSCYNQNAPRHTSCILFYFLSSQAAVPVAPPQDCLLMTDQNFQLTCLLGIMRYESHMNNTNWARQKISLDLDSTFPGKQDL